MDRFNPRTGSRCLNIYRCYGVHNHGPADISRTVSLCHISCLALEAFALQNDGVIRPLSAEEGAAAHKTYGPQ
jgi:hypothetical protein